MTHLPGEDSVPDASRTAIMSTPPGSSQICVWLSLCGL